MGDKIKVRLRDDSTAIEATVIEVTPSDRNYKWWQLGKRPCLEGLRWRCPCGLEIDTSTMSNGRFFNLVADGYLLLCPNCGRWYLHHRALGYVEGGHKERSIADGLFKTRPDEYGFIREVLAAPDNTDLLCVYADYLEERGDVRGEALRLKSKMASLPEADPRRGQLLARLEQLPSILDPEWFALVVRLGPATLVLAGCPASDLAELPEWLSAAGINSRPSGVVQDGDYVIYCMNCSQGIMPGTVEAVMRCAGRAIAPVAIVLTKAELIDDASLRDFVTMEEMELLSRILPPGHVETLPLYYDFDPGLARKLLSRISEGPTIITCGGA